MEAEELKVHKSAAGSEDLLHARVKVETTDDQFPVCEQGAGGGAELPEEEERHKYDPNIKLLVVTKEEIPSDEQEWSPSPEHDDPSELPHIKEEQEELWNSQEGEQLQGLEEADIIKFTFNPDPVKSEEGEEEEPQSSQLHHMEEKETSDGVVCGGPVPDMSLNSDGNSQPVTDEEMSHSSEPETDDSHDWKETGQPKSGLKHRRNKDLEGNTVKTHDSSSEHAETIGHEGNLQDHSGIETGLKTFSCSVCGKEYTWKKSLKSHMRLHSEGKSFSCPFCQKTFPSRGDFVRHVRVHTGEKPFSCSVCGTSFTRGESLREHKRIHTGEKPFTCSKCGRKFGQSGNLTRHMKIHTEEKPFRCSKCVKRFRHSGNLRRHMRVHTEDTL